MSIDDLINREEAGAIIGVDPRTVPRYAQRGLLDEVRQGRKSLYRREEVSQLREKFDARKELDSCIRELYVLTECGAEIADIMQGFGIKDTEKLDHALEIYKKERETYMRKFGLEHEKDELFLAGETAARLKLTDKHVIYDLIREGRLQTRKINADSRERYFVTKDSLMNYLGSYSKELLYRSSHVKSFNHGMTIEIVDR
ncbi:hypothetical protein GF345_02335, partial [Candidatus Woesearchaeota archaeon]|nr:hypothetical protein [Candidatus Woesearchaeota archaeon]